jgi:hypothetical protein
VILLENQGFREFYRRLPTLKGTCGEAQNKAVPECDYQLKNPMITARSPVTHRTGSVSSHIALVTTLSGAGVNFQLALKIKINKSKISSITCCEGTTRGIQVQF